MGDWAWAVVKEILGFEFDGNPGKHTIWLTNEKRELLLVMLKQWIRGARGSEEGGERAQATAADKLSTSSIPFGQAEAQAPTVRRV